MIQETNKKIDNALSQLRELGLLFESLRPQEPPKPVISTNIKKLVFKENWPCAVPMIHLCNHDSDRDRIRRARMILDQTIERDLTGKRLLHIMCGTGEVNYAALDLGVSISVGYDPNYSGYDKYPDADRRLLFAADEGEVTFFTKYDEILLYDALGYTQDPKNLIHIAANCVADNGLIYVRVRPWTSRYGMPDVRKLNKAYAHLLFDDHELATMGQDLGSKVWDYRMYLPLFREFGLRVRREKLFTQPIESLFKTPLMVQKMKEVLGTKEFPEDLLSICHVDYTLELNR
jgi:hypothetical protein